MPMIQTNPVILHCDCNGYFASVEILLDPSLRNIPMAVAGNPENRHGIILAKNDLAKAAGVVTAETINEAKRKCPDLICVKPHHDLYKKYSREINSIYLEYTDYVEPFSIDESFLDVSQTWMQFADSPLALADQIRERIRNEIGVTISVGVSYNKIFAKLGSDLKKPDATTIIMQDDVNTKVWPLDISNLMYVGKVTEQKLRRLNINTIGEIAAMDQTFLVNYLGKLGKTLSDYARGIDHNPVPRFDELEEAKSMGNGTTFQTDLTDWEQIREGLRPLAEEVSRRLRKANKVAGVLQVQMKSFDFQVSSRQMTLSSPLDDTDSIFETSIVLLQELWDQVTPIRLLTITANHLTEKSETFTQVSLHDWQEEPAREALIKAQENQQKAKDLEKIIQSINQDISHPSLQLGFKQKKK